MQLTLYHYWRSSSSWRVRWALAIKNITYDSVAVNLLKKEHSENNYKQKSKMGFVPCLEIDGKAITESLAIIEWLEEKFPAKPLLPKDPWDRLKVRELAFIIAAGTQPVQNLSVQLYYSDDKEKRKEYAHHWISKGLGAYEESISEISQKYSYGDDITIADLCLIPQCYNALRFGVNLSIYPKIKEIYERCLQLKTCIEAHPDNQ